MSTARAEDRKSPQELLQEDLAKHLKRERPDLTEEQIRQILDEHGEDMRPRESRPFYGVDGNLLVEDS
jgi:hypothetical protein